MKLHSLAVFVIALIACMVPDARAQAASHEPAAPSAGKTPAGLNTSDWQSIRAAYEAGRHAFMPVEGQDEFCGDGSMRQMTPTSPAVHLGAHRILVIGAAQLPTAVAAPGAGAGRGAPTISEPVDGSAGSGSPVERRRSGQADQGRQTAAMRYAAVC